MQEALYSSEVEQALWTKLKMKKPGWKFRDFRVQTDAHGWVPHLHTQHTHTRLATTTITHGFERHSRAHTARRADTCF